MLNKWKERWHEFWNRMDVWEAFNFFYPSFLILSIGLTLILLFIWQRGGSDLRWPCNWLFPVLDVVLICLTVYARKP